MKNKGGRPTVMTPMVLAKLETAFAMGCSDKEACLYAGIGVDPLYDYQKANPEFSKRKELLKEQPMLKARATIVKSLDKPQHAQWYAERKKKNEFSVRQEITGNDGAPIEVNVISYEIPKED